MVYMFIHRLKLPPIVCDVISLGHILIRYHIQQIIQEENFCGFRKFLLTANVVPFKVFLKIFILKILIIGILYHLNVTIWYVKHGITESAIHRFIGVSLCFHLVSCGLITIFTGCYIMVLAPWILQLQITYVHLLSNVKAPDPSCTYSCKHDPWPWRSCIARLSL